jgi:hypothetical protein
MPYKRTGSDCYVYALLDPRKPGRFSYNAVGIIVEFAFEPFYIGKGFGSRIFQHENLARRKPEPAKRDPKGNKIRKMHREGLAPISVKVRESLMDSEAYALEESLISAIGRFSDGGPLTNLSIGGRGGQTGNKAPEEVRAKLREGHAKRTKEEKLESERKRQQSVDLFAVARAANITKAAHSPARRAEIQAQRKATIASLGEEARAERASKAAASMSERNRLNPPAPVTCPHCGKTGSPRGVKKFHFDRCKFKAFAPVAHAQPSL